MKPITTKKSSSKVWRAGRWFWRCAEDNQASDWKDSWSCGAISKLTYSTAKEAEKASKAHERKTNHVCVVQKIVARLEKRRKKRRIRK